MAQNPQSLRRYNAFRNMLFNVQPGAAALEITTNLCDWFELGNREGNNYWLEAQIVGDDEFLFNGRLFLRGQAAGTIIDNFPRFVPQSWTKRQRAEGDGTSLFPQMERSSSDTELMVGYAMSPSTFSIQMAR